MEFEFRMFKARAEALLALNDSIDITNAFIVYYNALPKRTASVNQ